MIVVVARNSDSVEEELCYLSGFCFMFNVLKTTPKHVLKAKSEKVQTSRCVIAVSSHRVVFPESGKASFHRRVVAAPGFFLLINVDRINSEGESIRASLRVFISVGFVCFLTRHKSRKACPVISFRGTDKI